MVRVYRWDGKEMFINPDNIMHMEMMDKYTSVQMLSGPTLSLSAPSYEILSGHQGHPKKGPGTAGFSIL
jgi:hypothetical protein